MESERKSRYELFLEAEQEAPQTKRCTKCGEVKAFEEFHVCRRNKSGRTAECQKCHRKRYSPKYLDRTDRFWKFYHDHYTTVGDCLEWAGDYAGGVPVCSSWNGKKAVNLRRIVYRLSCGELSDDMFIILTCNNKRCVRQSHFKPINQVEMDAYRANHAATGDQHVSRTHPERLRRGEKVYGAKLTEEDVRTIRKQHVPYRVTYSALAAHYRVSPRTIAQVVQLKSWAHVQ